jgi:hypothetical protein
MKQILSILTITAVMAASCNTSPKTADANANKPGMMPVMVDTSGLAQFQQWKAQHELADPSNAYNPYAQQAAVAPAPVTRTVYVNNTPRRSSSSSTARRSSSASSGGSMNSTSSNTAMKKKGWSKAAKGAAIGGVAGGVAGAVINKKNRVVGGVVGGVLGAGAGYGIGRGMDKRDGRY